MIIRVLPIPTTSPKIHAPTEKCLDLETEPTKMVLLNDVREFDSEYRTRISVGCKVMLHDNVDLQNQLCYGLKMSFRLGLIDCIV